MPTTRKSTSPGAKTQAEVADEAKDAGAAVIEHGESTAASDETTEPGYSPFDTENKDPNAPETEEVVTPSQPLPSPEDQQGQPAAGTLVEQKPKEATLDEDAQAQRDEYERHTAKAVAEGRLEGDMTPPTAVDADEDDK